MELSFVIPVYNEEKSLAILHEEIVRAVGPLKKSFEIIFINDGSTDDSQKIIEILQKKDRGVRLINFRGNQGKAAGLMAGFHSARGEIVFTLDADLQDNPMEIPRFLAKINEGYDLVSGWKKQRHDPFSKVLPSRIYNWLASWLSGTRLHDFNCGFKAYRQEVIKNLKLYGELYRLIPVLAAEKKFKIDEIPVRHRQRRFGQSKFGWNRFIKGFLDMITVIFLTKFLRRPAHLFGTIGTGLLGSGLAIGLYMTYLKLAFGNIQGRQPLLLLGILLIMVGIQLFSIGLLAEMILYLNAAGKDKGADN